MNHLVFLLCGAMLLSIKAHAGDNNIAYRVKFSGKDKQITKKEIGGKNNLTVFQISELCFGEKCDFDTVVFKVSDIVGSTKLAKSKFVVKKDDWKLYEIKFQSQLYFYKSGGKEPNLLGQ
jgi:hypothetical protein